MGMLPGITQGIFHFLHGFGMWGLFVLLFIEEAGVPLPAPGDTLIALAGAQQGRTLEYTAQILGLSTLAVFLGSSLLYWLMRWGGRPFLNRYGRYIRLNPKRMERIEGWINRRGTAAIVLGRLIPGLRVPTTVMCGLSGVPYRVYAPSAALAGLVWSGLYFLIGALLRRHVGVLTSYVTGLLDTVGDSTLLSALMIALLIAALVGVWHAYRRGQGQRATRTSSAADTNAGR